MSDQTDPATTQPDGAKATGSSRSFGLQLLQLVVIPAVIVVVCITLAAMFGRIAGAKDNIETHLLKLRQSSGAGKMAFGIQDPRYKDRGLAAYNIATMIPRIETASQKQRVNEMLLEILHDYVAPGEWTLRSYLLMALGQLGQAGGLDAILENMNSEHPRVRQGAIGGVLSWPDISVARKSIGPLLARLQDEDPAVRAAATAALGWLAHPGDPQVITMLQEAMESSIGLEMREVRWNAAVALAKLGDAGGSRFVATVLLDRPALRQLAAGESGAVAQEKMPSKMQDRVILSALASLSLAPDPSIWDKIAEIADNDPSRAVRNAAKQLVMARSE